MLEFGLEFRFEFGFEFGKGGGGLGEVQEMFGKGQIGKRNQKNAKFGKRQERKKEEEERKDISRTRQRLLAS